MSISGAGLVVRHLEAQKVKHVSAYPARRSIVFMTWHDSSTGIIYMPPGCCCAGCMVERRARADRGGDATVTTSTGATRPKPSRGVYSWGSGSGTS
jgi:hypothetical protein